MNKPLVFFLADDDEDDRMLFAEALLEIDPAIKFLFAKNGQEALLILGNDLFESPDCIFLDLNMPIINGIKCLGEIKKINAVKHVPVILYSTSSDKGFVEESKKLGAMDFFIKPTNFSSLSTYLTKVVSMISSSRSHF